MTNHRSDLNRSQITVQKIGSYIIIVLGLIFACYAGGDIADENFVRIATVLGGLIFCFVLFSLGQSVYLLIPICWGLSGSIHVLPLPVSVRQIAIIIAGFFFISGLIFKRGQVAKSPFTAVDLWIWINLGYLLSVFLRNPVGINALGGDRVGGLPYVNVALGILTYFMLRRFTISAPTANRLIYWWIGVAAFSCLAGGIGMFFPGLGAKLSFFYSEFGGGDENEVIQIGETRLEFLSNFGEILGLYVVSLINPFEIFTPVNLRWLFTYFLGGILILLSGFRNAVGSLFLYTAFSSYLRQQWSGVARICVLVLYIALVCVGMSYSPITLPWAFQRSLSFLPGDWDPTAKEAAESSTKWRHEMWSLALTSDRYIHNKALGDGFGFLRSDYETMISINNGGEGFGEGSSPTQEAFMIAGEFHSGPVSSIRFVGVLGLCLFLPLLIMTAFYAYRVIRMTQGTPFQLSALFFGIPIVVFPIIFVFIFGDYQSDIVSLLFEVGMLKMFERSLHRYQTERLNQPLKAA